jgi:glutamine synthetase
MAITLPFPASYARMDDGLWSGGTYVCYGTDNREAPIRLCNAASPHSRNFEFRTTDGTANAAELSESEREALGINERLPVTWEDAREKMTQSAAVLKIFGANFVEKYLSINEVRVQLRSMPLR